MSAWMKLETYVVFCDACRTTVEQKSLYQPTNLPRSWTYVDHETDHGTFQSVLCPSCAQKERKLSKSGKFYV